MLQQVVYIIITITAGSEVVTHLPSWNIIATHSKFFLMVVKCIHFKTFQTHDTLHQDKIWARLNMFHFNCLFILVCFRTFQLLILSSVEWYHDKRKLNWIDVERCSRVWKYSATPACAWRDWTNWRKSSAGGDLTLKFEYTIIRKIVYSVIKICRYQLQIPYVSDPENLQEGT